MRILRKYEAIKVMSVEEMAKVIAEKIWASMCDCNDMQQLRCEHYKGKPAGGCIECITKDVEEWLESEVQEDER